MSYIAAHAGPLSVLSRALSPLRALSPSLALSVSHGVCVWVPKGTTRYWDKASRTTKQKDCGADAAAIFAVLRGSKVAHPQVLLVKQYRPPIEGTTIELPAGLIDKGETPVRSFV